MLYNLEEAANEIAVYINNDIDEGFISYLKQINNANLEQNNFEGYLSGLTKLLRLERITLICSTQTPDEKAYFLREYAKHKEEKSYRGNQKVR